MFKKILIANRGEIACRIASTCRRMGIKTVAIYSEVDAQARHVSLCDEAILVGHASASESYLCADRVLNAALTSGAQAIHPGYGFLSENAAFAQACIQAGLIFIGPPAQAIAAMGSKSAAKKLMEQSGIPLVPGYHGDNQTPDFLQAQADAIGYPILIKASSGGGGKGMRIVRHTKEFQAALSACQREASHSFGDAHVLLEKYLEQPRHIEVQIFADQNGNCISLFERDCSIQRRHQKVIEEAPAPGLSNAQRQAMGQAAVAAAQAVNYVGAGTVEFIADQQGVFYFMEMNTRLQVEHPVTEMITGYDLVEWQIAIAAGQPLPASQQQLSLTGHAFEARIYAENPDKQFLPTTGTLTYLKTPPTVEFIVDRSTTRIDSGVRQGDSITPYYDPMIAKLIVWGETRVQALSNMRQALAQFQVAGLKTNIDFLIRLFDNAEFSQAQLDTGLIERHHNSLLTPTILTPVQSFTLIAAATAARLQQEQHAAYDLFHFQLKGRMREPSSTDKIARYASEIKIESPWAQTDGWRISGQHQRTLQFLHGAQQWTVKLIYQANKIIIQAFDQSAELDFVVQENGDYRVTLNDRQYTFHIFVHNNHFYLYTDCLRTELIYHDPLMVEQDEEHSDNQLTAPMPGKILAIHAQHGQSVTKGMPLLVMEAMKMEHTITAPINGVIEAIHFSEGEQVTEGAQLLSLTALEGDTL